MVYVDDRQFANVSRNSVTLVQHLHSFQGIVFSSKSHYEDQGLDRTPSDQILSLTVEMRLLYDSSLQEMRLA